MGRMRVRGMARLGTLVLALAVAVAVLVGGGYWFLVRTAAGQDFLLDRLAGTVLTGGLPAEFDGLRVFMCGTSGPLVAPGRAQTCVAITAGDSLYLFDAGEGSADVAQLHGLPTATLRAIFVTHMHSDHIAGISNFNLASWVQGTPGAAQGNGAARHRSRRGRLQRGVRPRPRLSRRPPRRGFPATGTRRDACGSHNARHRRGGRRPSGLPPLPWTTAPSSRPMASASTTAAARWWSAATP